MSSSAPWSPSSPSSPSALAPDLSSGVFTDTAPHNVAVSVRGLSKSYSIAKNAAQHTTAGEALMHRLRHPFAKAERETFLALDDVSFDIQKGDVVGIIGRNGAGKSTLLKILSRITEPTRGRIDLYGRVGSLLEVGTGFHPELTGRENIFLNGAILGMQKSEIARQFDAIVDFSGTEQFLDTPVKRYSSGMYVRLAFAVAAHLNPEILIIDEVLAVGDAEFQKKCLGKMQDVAKSGRTVLFVSHNMGVVANLCSQAILLSNGQISEAGSVNGVVNQYISCGAEFSGERVWKDKTTAPGNENVRLHRVRIVSDNKVSGDVSIDKPVHVEFEFWNLRPNAILSANIHLLDKIGIGVLSAANWTSASLTKDDWFGRPYPVGLFRATCTLPADFLNEGMYTINVLVMNQISNIELFAKEAVQFYVHDTGSMRGEWGGDWLGVVRPRLAWKTEKLDTQFDPEEKLYRSLA